MYYPRPSCDYAGRGARRHGQTLLQVARLTNGRYGGPPAYPAPDADLSSWREEMLPQRLGSMPPSLVGETGVGVRFRPLRR
jgi:hypothetical protein